MSDLRAPIYAALSALGIEYELFEHPPVFTAEEAAVHWGAIPGAAVKNLFLRNKKGDRHYLVILGIEKQADLRQLVKLIGDDRVMKLATRHGLPHPLLMRFVLKLMANLTDPRGGDAMDRVINALSRLAPAA